MNSIRDAVNSAMQSDTTEAPETPAAATPVEDLAEVPSFDAPETTPAPAAATTPRDATGRFAKPGSQQAAVKTTPPSTPATPGQTAAPAATPTAPEAKPAAPAVKAPQSWKPEVREKFAALPPEVQQEVTRREREVATALQQAAEARKTAESFTRAVEPYRALMTDAPEKVVGNLLKTAAVLRTGTPQMKAQLLAQVIQANGVPIDLLDAVLSGQAPQQGQQPAQPAFDPNALLQQAEERVMQRFQTQAQQAIQAKARAEAEAFINSGEAEFIDDVRPIMANLLAAAGQSGIPLTLKDAYNQACMLSPDVSRVLKQREQAQQANVTQASTQRARNAAASVRTSPAAPPGNQKPADLRSTIIANWNEQSGR